MNSTLIVARNEFSIIARNPIIILFGALMLVLALINAAGCSTMLPNLNLDHNSAFMVGVGNIFWRLSMFFAFLSVCIGIISIADERSNGSLRVLFTKPLYRRDVITGKFVGISSFLFMLIALTIALYVSLIMIVYGGPESIIDLSLRMGLFAAILFLNCSVTLGLVMFLGIIIPKSEALVISLSFISMEWLTTVGPISQSLGNLQIIDPIYLYVYALSSPQANIFTNIPLGSWFSNSSIYIVLMIVEAILILLINCMLFIREEA